MGFALGMMAVFWHPIEWQLYDVLNVLNVTELFILSIDFILCEFHQKKKNYILLLSPHRSEEANKAFSAAVQMHDVLVKAWAMWGDYLENIFVKERQLHLGVSAITCYLHACRHQNESKSRKYLAKVRPKEPVFTKDRLVAFRFAQEGNSFLIRAGG